MKKPQLSELTLREKIGQTVMVQGPHLMAMENMKEFIGENPIGGIWHTCNASMNATNLTDAPIDKPENCEFYRKWAKSYAEALKVPPFVALDGPGGGTATDIHTLVSDPLIGAANDDQMAYDSGKYRALQARAVGANWIWSPNVDIASRFSIAIMRTCSDDVEKLSRLSAQIIKGMQDHKVASSIKHFPGKDQVEYRDPHFAPAYNHSSMEQWRQVQGKAMKNMIDAGVWSVMVGHHGFPASDDRKIGNTYWPSTISYNTITKLLKEELGFEGVVVTDAIDMAALKVAYPNPKDLLVALLNAGVDVILNVRQLNCIDLIEEAVNEGRISMERLDDACRRILDMKEKMGLFDDDLEEIEMTEELSREVAEFNEKASRQAITLECDVDNQLPLDPSKIKNVAIVLSTHNEGVFDAIDAMKEAFERRGMKVTKLRHIRSDEEMEKIAAENDLIVYASYIAAHQPMGGASFFGDECATFFYAFTQGIEKSVGVSLGSVYTYYDFYQNMKMFVHAYSTSKESQEAFVDAIFGDIPFEGTMPYLPPGPREE